MFSGLIAHAGRVHRVERLATGGSNLTIAVPSLHAADVALGDSIAIDGVCLTVTAFGDDLLTFDVVPETLQRSTLASYSAGQQVNVELSLRLGDRLGGHLVYGHVDTHVEISEKIAEGQGYRVKFERPLALQRYLVEKGYVALDGVSLTIASVTERHFSVALIPETALRTTLGEKRAGSFVNLEVDPIARYACDLAAGYVQTIV